MSHDSSFEYYQNTANWNFDGFGIHTESLTDWDLYKLLRVRTDITFRVMDNLNMDVPDNYFDAVVARHTCTDPVQIMRCLKPGGHLLIRGVDKQTRD